MFGRVALADGLLDMRRGLAQSIFVEEVQGRGGPGEAKPLPLVRTHHREWFASSVDQVRAIMTLTKLVD